MDLEKLLDRVCFDADGGASGGAGAELSGEPGADPESTKESEKTLSQEEVNGLLAREKNKAIEGLLKELGAEDAKSVKASLKQLKELQDSQKSETEKLAESLEAEKASKAEAEKRATALEARLSAITQGVDPKKVDKFVKIAMTYDGETVEDKITEALADFEEFKTGKQQVPAVGSKTKNDPPSTEESIYKEFYEGLSGF